MSSRKQTIRAPISRKRRLVRKLIRMTGSTALLAAGNQIVLDTIEEEETLVRIVGNVNITPLVANPGAVVMYIVVWPSGTDLWSATIAPDVLDGRDAKAVLWHKTFQSSNDSANADPFIIDFDVKGMRKLSEGDTVEFIIDCDSDNTYTVMVLASLFYKKA